MIKTIEMCILLFFSYSILGWLMEVIVKYFQFRRFINRGFLIGPYCPIYGWGALLITFLLKKYSNDPLALFIFGMIVCAILEYLTSYIMEKLFNARWWDYSQKKFNINGRICLDTMIPFGLLGLLITYVINPLLFNIFNKINSSVLSIICIILILAYITDNIISIGVLKSIKNNLSLLEKDNTEEITNKIKSIIASLNWRQKRLLSSYPNVEKIFDQFMTKFENSKLNIIQRIINKYKGHNN